MGYPQIRVKPLDKRMSPHVPPIVRRVAASRPDSDVRESRGGRQTLGKRRREHPNSLGRGCSRCRPDDATPAVAACGTDTGCGLVWTGALPDWAAGSPPGAFAANLTSRAGTAAPDVARDKGRMATAANRILTT